MKQILFLCKKKNYKAFIMDITINIQCIYEYRNTVYMVLGCGHVTQINQKYDIIVNIQG